METERLSLKPNGSIGLYLCNGWSYGVAQTLKMSSAVAAVLLRPKVALPIADIALGGDLGYITERLSLKPNGSHGNRTAPKVYISATGGRTGLLSPS
jgi:hypothetical protein